MRTQLTSAVQSTKSRGTITSTSRCIEYTTIHARSYFTMFTTQSTERIPVNGCNVDMFCIFIYFINTNKGHTHIGSNSFLEINVEITIYFIIIILCYRRPSTISLYVRYHPPPISTHLCFTLIILYLYQHTFVLPDMF